MDTLGVVAIARPQSNVVGVHIYCLYTFVQAHHGILGRNMSRGTFVVVGIAGCLRPDRGVWELTDSHGADTVSVPLEQVEE